MDIKNVLKRHEEFLHEGLSDDEDILQDEAILQDENLIDINQIETIVNPYVDLSYADLSLANLVRAILHNAYLVETNLTHANLHGANLTSANLSRANLSRANLTSANLSRANLRGANLNHAIGIVCAGTDPRGYRFVGVAHPDGPRVAAGCRWFTIPEARTHWANNRDALARVALIEATLG